MIYFTCINGHVFPAEDYSIQCCPTCRGAIIGCNENYNPGGQQNVIQFYQGPSKMKGNMPADQNSKKNTWKIVVSIIAALLLAAGVIFSVWFFLTKKPKLTGVKVILKQESKDQDYTKVWEIKNNMVIEARTYGSFQVELKPIPENAKIEDISWKVEDRDLLEINEYSIKILESEKYEKTGVTLTVTGDDQTFDCTFSFDVKHAGWNKVGNNWYFITETGEYLKNDWRVDGDRIRYVNEEGILVSGWLQLTDEEGKDRAYYFDPSDDRNMLRSITTSEKVKDGNPDTEYTFDEDGHLVNNWITIDDKSYYYDSDGVMVKGRKININGRSYSFDENGILE